MSAGCLVGDACPWGAEQNKGVRILWTDKGLVWISRDLNPLWIELRCLRLARSEQWGLRRHRMLQRFGADGKQGAVEHVVSRNKVIFSSIYVAQEAAPATTGIRITNIPGGVGGNQNGPAFITLKEYLTQACFYFIKAATTACNVCWHTSSTPCYVVLAELCQSSPSVPAQPGHASVTRCCLRSDADWPVGNRTGRDAILETSVPNAPSCTWETEHCHSSRSQQG